MRKVFNLGIGFVFIIDPKDLKTLEEALEKLGEHPDRHRRGHQMQQSPRIAILISGTGTNMHAILNAIKDGELDAVPVFVGSDKATAKGLTLR